MKKTIKKLIKPDKNKTGSQVIINIKEDDIQVAINQSSGVSQLYFTFNQICSLSKVLHEAIDTHYQEYSNRTIKEKKEKICINDPIDW